MLVIPEVNMFAGYVEVITFVVLSMSWHNIQAPLVLLQSGLHSLCSKSLQPGWSGDRTSVEARFSISIQRDLRYFNVS